MILYQTLTICTPFILNQIIPHLYPIKNHIFIVSLLTVQRKKKKKNETAGIKFHMTQTNGNSINVFISENKML